MPTPIIEQIAVKIKARLAEITTANSYTWNADVVRPTRIGGFVPKDKQVVLFQAGRELADTPGTEGSSTAVEWWQTFAVAVYAISSDKSTDPIETLINVRHADVEKALQTPTDDETETDWAKIDGLALNSEMGTPEWFDYPDFSGVAVALRVHYRVKENDPYTQA